MKAIINGKILLRNEVLENKILVFDKKIIDITDEVPSGCEVIDVEGKIVSPGLIDIHIHGNMGKDTMEGTDGGFIHLWRWQNRSKKRVP